MTRTLTLLALLLAIACATNPAPPAAQTAPEPAAAAAPVAPPETRPAKRPVIIAARGLSCQSAIVISATTERTGIAEEKAWISENYPGAKVAKQELTTCNDKPADQLDLETANGRTVSVYFDISNFFGKH
ncbi:MAG: hypothetical protein QOF63_1483 [Thermoanaerobaculia bacterium]|jgi:hypothetical protein|nr:hypothetical protein [Thermoanaerobaculia bacterium]